MHRSSDPVDASGDLVEHWTQVALARIQNPEQLKIPTNFDGVNCIVCDLTIPPARLALGKFRCVSCQSKFER